jgi:epsilon-lactone hydrolase
MTETRWQPEHYHPPRQVRTQASPVGLVVLPPGPARAAILYIPGTGVPGTGVPGTGVPGTGVPGTGAEAHQRAPEVAAQLALRTGATVVCCRYRDTFPAALDDVAAAYRYSQAAGPVAIAGERLGAALAAALVIHLRDTDATLPPCAVLASALLDLTLQAPSLRLNAAANPAVDVTAIEARITRYAGPVPRTNPLLSPLQANLHGLPPLQLLAAGNDILIDDSVAFAGRAARSGVTVDLRVRPTGGALRAEAPAAMAAFISAWSRPPGRSAGL